MCLKKITAGSLVILVLGLVTTWAAATERLSRQDAMRLLELGWNSSPVAQAEATKLYDQMLGKSNRDPRVVYLYALTKIKQERYAEAARLLEPLSATGTTDRHVLRARAWLAMATRRYDEALGIAEDLAAALPEEPDLPIVAPDDLATREDVLFLGRLVGYLDGPASHDVSAMARGDAQRRTMSGWSPARRLLFREAYHSVLQVPPEWKRPAPVSPEPAKDHGLAEQAERHGALSLERKELLAGLQELRRQDEEMHQRIAGELAPLDRDHHALEKKYSMLQTQTTALRRQLEFLRPEISRLDWLAEHGSTPELRVTHAREAALARAQLKQVSEQFTVNLKIAERIELQHEAIEQQASFVRSTYAAVFDANIREQRAIEHRLGWIDAHERQEHVSPTVESATDPGREGASNEYVKFEPFPLEAERQRILDEWH